MQLSIIIVSYQVKPFLQLCLQSVFAAIDYLDSEVIVVDNASKDGSCDMIVSDFPEVILIENRVNLGFSKANNQGVKHAKGEYVCILNPDTVVGEDCFDRVYAFAKAQPDTGIIGVQLVDGTGKFLPECKRNLPTPSVSLNKLLGSGNRYYANHLSPNDTGPVAVLVGAFMFLAKEVYEAVGGFDERYFMYGEDIDLSFSVTRAGFTNYYLGDVTVIHFKGESSVKDKIYRERFYGAMQLFYDKYFKKNRIQGWMVESSLWAAKRLARKDEGESTHIIDSKKDAYLLSKDSETREQLELATAKAVILKATVPQVLNNALVYMQGDYMTYLEMIHFMTNDDVSDCAFRFIPKNCTFAIGSDDALQRGVIIDF